MNSTNQLSLRPADAQQNTATGLAKPWPILLLVRELGIGGIERDVTKLALKLDRGQFEPHVGCFIAKGFRYAELRNANIPIIELPVRSFISPSIIRAGRVLCDYVTRRRIRLVHSYDVPTTEFSIPIAKLCGTPVVISSQLGYRDLFRKVDRVILRATDRMVDRIVVNCEAMRRHMIEDEGVAADRVYLCYNGVDTSSFFPGERQLKPIALAEAGLIIGTVGALRPEKRADLLISAFARIHRLKPKLKLLVVGSGPLLQSLQTHAASLGVLDRCVFEPATDDVAPWMRMIDIFVLPSDSEAFSNALLEAMACGCCPIGSRIGGTPELIEHERTGLLFERGNLDDLCAMLMLAIMDTQRREAMAMAAATFARDQLSIERAATTMGALYASLLSKRS